ncbi:Rrf2 family transcriptional regulator [Sporolactobacillus sp. Y61]|uniref:Rrf2 family transcriptional regulator n=1 Tax=Sporolactobacillus sp. Y61 TaxID=3160863 RepID=A0AAU8IHA3_9BACL|nr:Rrf2 family transcriptional regulator [Sporolactobacillus sp. THM19-2]RYL92636.1 Rrf2 family transcriptional regulator [Sporolactobacillus sp. THM19-2]
MNSEFTIAVHCLILLASAPDHLWNSESLSRKVHTHPARIRKIMSILRKRRLVSTKEGLGGGYRLDCDPGTCTLARIYRSTSCAALKLSWCSSGCMDDPDTSGIQQVMNQAFSGAEQILENYLEQWTLENLLEQVRKIRNGSSDRSGQEFVPSGSVQVNPIIQKNKIGGEV